jgi:hypothetical protein
VGDDVRETVWAGRRRKVRTAAVAVVVLATMAGCGVLPGQPGGSAAPTGGEVVSSDSAAGAADGPGSSPTQPVPLGQAITVKSGIDADFEWQITVTGIDTKSYSPFDFTDDKPCFTVLGTAKLVKAPDGKSGASGIIEAPGIFLVDKGGQSINPEPCVAEKDTGYKSALDLDASTGETIKFADSYASDASTEGVALKLQDAISLADGGGADEVYAAIR